MENKLVITNYKDKELGLIFNEKNLIRILNLDSNIIVGNIYCGYVKDIVKNINAAFVEFEDKKGYLLLDPKSTLKQGDKVMVQVSGDKIKTKDYSLTDNISLPGKALVLTTKNKTISISRKINDNNIRNELKKLIDNNVSKEYGFIIRTCATTFTNEELLQEANELIKIYETIVNSFNFSSPKKCIYKQDNFLKKIDDFIDKYHGKIITDKEYVYNQIKEKPNVDFYKEKISMDVFYSIEKNIKSALCKKVWLKSGAYLIIEKTEAMTVIDVNTGKVEKKRNREKTFENINIEAAREIIRQLQIRNISGLIMVDFINVKRKEFNNYIMDFMKELAAYDYIQCSIVDFTALGIMEITRKKTEKPIDEVLGSE